MQIRNSGFQIAELRHHDRDAGPAEQVVEDHDSITRRGLLGILCLLASALTGCGSTGNNTALPPPPSDPVAGVSFNGRVIAGALPVAAATVQLYAAGSSGNGSASTALLASSLSTDSNGAFTVPSTFSCATGAAILFLLAKGGRVGNAANANPALWWIAPLGPCSSLSATTSVTINEATTIASAFALSPFLSVGGNLGASSTNTLGLANAVIIAQTLVNMSAGSSPGADLPANVSVETSKLNTLANAFTPCATSGLCSDLFQAADASGDITPTNTLDAALEIARHPGNAVAGIYALSSGTVFPGTLSSAPPDWTLAITLTEGGLNAPIAVALDGFGNIWIANYNAAVSAFSPGGKPIFLNGVLGDGLNESHGIAIDPANNVWIANDETPDVNNNMKGTVTELSHAGAPLSGAFGYIGSGLDYPTALAANTDGSMWVVNYADASVTLLTPSGTAAAGVCNSSVCGYSGASIDFPDAIAVDNNHFAWVGNSSNGYVTRISPDGTQMTSVNCCYGAQALAIDSGGYLWSANHYGNSVSLVASSGSIVSIGYSGGGIDDPHGIAIDGSGNVWVANYQGNSISELSGSGSAAPGSALSPATGFGADAHLASPYGIAIDSSGSVWVANYTAVPLPGMLGTVTQFVGLAEPVATPLVGPVRLP